MRKSLSLGIVLSLLSDPVLAVKHIQPNAYPNAQRDEVHVPSRAAVRRFGSPRAAVLASATGTKNVAVIIVQFPSASASLTSGSRLISSLANINSYYTQMQAFYDESSLGTLDLQFHFFGNLGANQATAPLAGAYTLANSMEYYGCGDEGTGCSGVTTPTSPSVSANGNYLLRDAIKAARTADATFSSALYDAVIVTHAGNGNETTLTAGDIWSIFYSEDTVIDGSNPVDAVAAAAGFTEGYVVPETESSGITSPLGVMCHEFGHTLGLPDLYNTLASGGTSVVGNWDIMDSGPFLGNGTNPAHHGAWCKVAMGWATPTTLTTRGSFTLRPAEAPGATFLKLPVQNGGSQEYFLLEYRLRSAGTYDANIPGDGVLVWHVDDAITSARGVTVSDPSLSNTVNTGSPHYGVSIVTADGITISNANQGDAGNAFVDQDVFTSPKSDNFEGDPSGISVVNIAGVGGASVAFDVANLAVSATQRILKVISYPNPAGKGYAHASGEGHATLQFQLGRPAQDYQINLYTLSGDIVRKIPKDQITLNITRSADNKWVYEFIWDLTNGDGRMVAPGTYIYLVRADGETKSQKLVVIR